VRPAASGASQVEGYDMIIIRIMDDDGDDDSDDGDH